MRYLAPAFVLAILAAPPALANGALAIDENQGDQWGWAVDYPDIQSAHDRAMLECGESCFVVADFDSGCSAYGADAAEGSTVWSWSLAETRSRARDIALAECIARGGTQCIIRAWGCNSRPLAEPEFHYADGAPPTDAAPVVAGTQPTTPEGKEIFMHIQAVRPTAGDTSTRTNFCGWTIATADELESYKSGSRTAFYVDESAYSANGKDVATLYPLAEDGTTLVAEYGENDSPISQRFLAAITAHPEYDGSRLHFVEKSGNRLVWAWHYPTDGAWSLGALTGFWCDFMVRRDNTHYYHENPETAVIIGRF